MSRIITESMKGKPCPYGKFLDRPTPNICQEGYCHGCQIYLDWQKPGRKGGARPTRLACRELVRLFQEAGILL